MVSTLALLGGIGTPELLVILVVALLLFGPKNLPKMARSLGKAMEEFRRAAREVEDELTREPAPPPEKMSLPEPPPETAEAPAAPLEPPAPPPPIVAVNPSAAAASDAAVPPPAETPPAAGAPPAVAPPPAAQDEPPAHGPLAT